jgi:hypothetical protein
MVVNKEIDYSDAVVTSYIRRLLYRGGTSFFAVTVVQDKTQDNIFAQLGPLSERAEL